MKHPIRVLSSAQQRYATLKYANNFGYRHRKGFYHSAMGLFTSILILIFLSKRLWAIGLHNIQTIFIKAFFPIKLKWFENQSQYISSNWSRQIFVQELLHSGKLNRKKKPQFLVNWRKCVNLVDSVLSHLTYLAVTLEKASNDASRKVKLL